MAQIRYFDAGCSLGRHLLLPDDHPQTAERLVAEMNHFGIHDALVIDTLANTTDPMAGNVRILERTADHPRLHPAWVGLGTPSHEMPPPAELVSHMRESGVGALFLFYQQFDTRLEPWAVDDLLAELQKARVPLFLSAKGALNQSGKTDWNNVVRICGQFPELPVIVTEYRIYGDQRALYGALAASPNLKVDLSALWLHKRIEFICCTFGADRLVWASQMPERTPASPLMQLNYSDISDHELALIAGDTMRNLLSWNPHIRFAGDVEFSQPVDALHKAARERVSLRNEEFYDCHGHIGWCSNRHVVHDEPGDIIAEMDKFGIRACCVFSFAGAMPDEEFGNNRAVEMRRAYPDRFIGFTLVNPAHGEDAMLAELHRGLELGMQGVKLAVSFQGYPLDGPLIDVVCRFAHDHRQFILNHAWGPEEHMHRLCMTYPDACFFTGHATTAYGELAREVDNLYICTCPLLGWGRTEQFVELYGADRILFGSDLMDLPIAWGLGPILYARIPEADKRLILGENLLRLMDRYDIHPPRSSAAIHRQK